MKILNNFIKLPKYSVIIGHSPKAEGAINKKTNISEFVFNSQLADKIKEIYNNKQFANQETNETKSIKEIIDLEFVYRTTYSELPNKINKTKCKASISLHCNAVAGNATGTEVLCKNECSKSKKLAQCLLNNLVHSLQLRNRGIKFLDVEDRGGYLLYNTNFPCVISEPFFISNDFDLDRALDCFEELAEAVLISFLEYEGLQGVVI